MAVVLITGCSSGFGRLTALEACRRGHTVYAGVRRPESVHELQAAAPTVRVLSLDVTDPDARDRAVERILAEEGRIDALVNNAGRVLGGFLEDFDEDEIRQLFEVNVFGAWAMTRACLPAMRAQRSGTVVMLSSVSGMMALPGLGAYGSTKFALEGMSEAWRHELRPFGIEVVVLQPGPYRTEVFGRNQRLGRHVHADDNPYAAWATRLQGLADQAADSAGDPQDIAVRICQVIAQSRPRFRHPMGPGARARAFATRLLPFSLLELVVGRLTGLRRGASDL